MIARHSMPFMPGINRAGDCAGVDIRRRRASLAWLIGVGSREDGSPATGQIYQRADTGAVATVEGAVSRQVTSAGPMLSILTIVDSACLCSDLVLDGRPAGTICVVMAAPNAGTRTAWFAAQTENVNVITLEEDRTTGLAYSFYDAGKGVISDTLAPSEIIEVRQPHLVTMDWGPLGFRLFFNRHRVAKDATASSGTQNLKTDALFAVNKDVAAQHHTFAGFAGVWLEQCGPAMITQLLRFVRTTHGGYAK